MSSAHGQRERASADSLCPCTHLTPAGGVLECPRWEVFISNRALDASHLAGRLTCEGIFGPDSSNECPTRAITRPRAARTGITPLPRWLPFSFEPPALALSAALFSPSLLEIITRHVRRPVGGEGGGGGCHTAS